MVFLAVDVLYFKRCVISGKYLQNEIMCGTIFSSTLYMSPFTMALMEDSGWYQIDFTFSQHFTWGADAGCAFINGDCVERVTATSNFEQFWCSGSGDNGCSADYSTIAECKNQVTSSIPAEFQWYSAFQPNFGGPASHDYCAFKTPVTRFLDYEDSCTDLRGNYVSTQTTYPSAIYALDARCVTVDDGSSRQGICFKHDCVGWDHVQKRYNAVRITTSDTTSGQTPEDITCLRTDKLLWKQSASYSMRIQCPDIDTVCGSSTGPFSCDRGEWSDDLAQCICSVGYVGADCSDEDKNRLADEATLYAAVSAPATSMTTAAPTSGLCISGSALAVINGYYHINGTFEGLPSYASSSKSVYYSRYCVAQKVHGQ